VTITAASPRPINVGGSFSISTLLTDPGQDAPWKVTITWAPGVTQVINRTTQGIAFVTSHTYNKRGNFKISVTVQDDRGKTTSNTLTLQVN
jgi:hypothetical protein